MADDASIRNDVTGTVDLDAAGQLVRRTKPSWMEEQPMRCAECDCENGGDECNWIKLGTETDGHGTVTLSEIVTIRETPHTRQIGRGTVQTQPGQPMPEPLEVWPAVAASGGVVRHEAVKDVSAVCDKLDAAHELARLRKQAKLYQSIITAHTERHHAIMDRAEKAEAEVARLRGLLWFARHEFNAIRAREGTTNGVAEEWWSQMTDMFGEAIGAENNTPWPSPEAKAILAALKGERDE